VVPRLGADIRTRRSRALKRRPEVGATSARGDEDDVDGTATTTTRRRSRAGIPLHCRTRRSVDVLIVARRFYRLQKPCARNISVPLSEIYCTYHVTDSTRMAARLLPLLVGPPGTVFQTLSLIRTPPKLLLGAC